MSTKILRVNSQSVLDVVRQSIRDAIQRTDIFPSCLSCRHWDETAEICKKYSARPPAPIIANGCPEYDDFDDIPF